jgi:PAS domain S-box-containing protein
MVDTPESGPSGQPVRLEDEAFLASIVASSDDAIIGKSLDGIILSWNAGARAIYGYTPEEVVGKSILMLVPPERQHEVTGILDRLKRGERTDHYETIRRRKDGRLFPVSLTVSPIRNKEGQVVAASTIARDISERVRAQEALTRERISEEILEMSTPVTQVWEGVVCAAVIGTLDSRRAQQLMELLLERIAETSSTVALVDVTGVPAVDTQTARHLIETAAAVRLLGGQVILTGIGPRIAQALVHLGIDLSEVVTRASLASGFRLALEILGLEIVNKKDNR